VSIKYRVGWAPVTSIDYVLTHTGYMGPRKLSIFDSHRVG
jgi:hypothetical protein